MTGPSRTLTEFEKRVATILSNLNNTLVSKNADYGDSYAKSVEKRGTVVSLIRLEDKLNRYEQLIMNPGSEKVDESIEDTLLDLAGYALLEIERRMREKDPLAVRPMISHRKSAPSPFEEYAKPSTTII